MVLKIREFPMAWEFPEPREISATQEFPRLKLFPPISWKMGISREFPTHGFPLSIPVGPSSYNKARMYQYSVGNVMSVDILDTKYQSVV